MKEYSRDFIFGPASGPEKGEDFLDLRGCAQIHEYIRKKKPELVFHLAATFSDNFDDALQMNVMAARTVMEAVLAARIGARVVLAGSAAEYGCVPESASPVVEDYPLRPISVYGLTKSWQSGLASVYVARGVDVVVARIFNLLGERMSDMLFMGRLQRQIGELIAGKRTQIEVGSLAASRDYLPVEDAVHQIMAIARHGKTGETYHVASGKPIQIKNLLIKEMEEKGLDLKCVIEKPELQHWQGTGPQTIYADMTKTRSLMGD